MLPASDRPFRLILGLEKTVATQTSLENSEFVNYADCVAEQLYQSLSDRLDFPPTKIPERYTRLTCAVVLKVICNLNGFEFGVCLLISGQDSFQLAGKDNGHCIRAENKFSVLIDNVEVVDYPKRIVQRIGGIMRLKSFDQISNIRVRDSLYFSFKTLGSYRDCPGRRGEVEQIGRASCRERV